MCMPLGLSLRGTAERTCWLGVVHMRALQRRLTAVEEEVVAQGNKLMAEALGAMLTGHEAVYKKLPVVGRRGLGGRGSTSPALSM